MSTADNTCQKSRLLVSIPNGNFLKSNLQERNLIYLQRYIITETHHFLCLQRREAEQRKLIPFSCTCFNTNLFRIKFLFEEDEELEIFDKPLSEANGAYHSTPNNDKTVEPFHEEESIEPSIFKNSHTLSLTHVWKAKRSVLTLTRKRARTSTFFSDDAYKGNNSGFLEHKTGVLPPRISHDLTKRAHKKIKEITY